MQKQIGSIIKFGNYNWQVLDVNENKALVITKDIIELRAFHNKISIGILHGSSHPELDSGSRYTRFLVYEILKQVRK